MSGLIPRPFIDQVLALTDIVTLIDERVPLKKAGKNFTACCPFHNEKTPSFSVNPTQQFYHCFGCGASGNAISFLMDFDRLDFVAAIEHLARQRGLIIPYEEQGNSKHKDTKVDKTAAYPLLMQVAKLYQKQLKIHSNASDYLKARGLSGEIARHFGVGFAPDQWHFLSQQLPHNEALLADSGMLITKDDAKRYDRFRHRIMFPIRDTRGRVVGFGGRVMNDEQPKYLNSPETPYFHKSSELYGLYEARLANRELRQLVVVEGYMDVLALAQCGITTAVAALGTATSTEHVEKMSRLTTNIVFCFDGDKAGRQAAWRALTHALPALRDGVALGFVFLPEGEDPDSYVRRYGRETFEHLLLEAQPLSRFLFAHLSEDCALHTAEGRAKLVDKVMPLLRQIPTSTLRDLLLDELIQLSKMPKKALLRLLLTHVKSDDAAPAALQTVQSYRLVQSPMRVAIHLLLSCPRLANSIPTDLAAAVSQLDLPGASLLLSLIERCRDCPEATMATLLEAYRDQAEFTALLKLTAQPLLDLAAAALDSEWSAVLKKLVQLQRGQQIQDLHRLMGERSLTAVEKSQLVTLLSQNL